MVALALLIGPQSDPILAEVEKALSRCGVHVLALANLAGVGVTTTIGGLQRPCLRFGDNVFYIDNEACALVVDLLFLFEEGVVDPTSKYRWAEWHAAWFTFLSLFPGKIINRPSHLVPPIHNDGPLSRTVARQLGIPVIGERIGGPGVPADEGAVIDLASGISLWAARGQRLTGVASQLAFGSDAEHSVAVVLPSGTTVLEFGALTAPCVIAKAGRQRANWAELLVRRMGLDYAYVVFVRADNGWALTRVYKSPPPIIGREIIETVSNDLSQFLWPNAS